MRAAMGRRAKDAPDDRPVAVSAAEALMTPTLFATYASQGRYRIAPHLALIDDVLLDCANHGGVRAIIEMPPRHGKSETISRYGPAWFLGVQPDARVAIVSYEATFAQTWGAKSRDTFAEYAPAVFHVKQDPGRSGAKEWGVYGHPDGGLVATGIGGPLTGRGVDLLIIDDPVKNAEEALSKTIRDSTFEWYLSTARSRLEPGGSIIVLQTRWHEDDLAGRLQAGSDEEYADVWSVLSLAALAEDDDPLGRAPGEPLWPDRYPLEALLGLKASVGSFWWAAQFQQRPSPLEGGMLQRAWWRHWTEDPVLDAAMWDGLLGSWDCNFKGGAGSDYVVGQVWGRFGARFYLLDQVRGQWSFTETLDAVRTLRDRWPAVSTWVVEKAANGEAVIDSLRSEMPGLVGEPPVGSKEARVSAISGLVESGSVYLPDPRREPWVSEWIEECAVFPNGAHDDQVDAMTQGLRRLRAHTVQTMRNVLR